ncbi:hypothetical protein DB30_03680 [Enhygromyxa salina]|uniref:Uncharacterized protein n=1 Tax=Enhygromyxa salina TaxID=215803 RepID=A0A0C2A104_9BACT|nr:hypothetical protein DB30_03680 [Enhygromyxa salina]
MVVGGEGGARRMIMAPSVTPVSELSLDDRPLAIERSADARYLIVTLPYELWIIDAKTLAEQRTIPLSMAWPSVVEGWEGALWIGGQHLFRGSVGSTAVTKAGTKLGGYVDHVTLIRDDLLCGVGSQGELLWDIDRDAPVHKRKSPGPAAIAVVASADGRAVFSDGSPTAWVIDPAHPAGYAQLRLSATSPVPVAAEGIVRLARTDGTRGGRVLLAARDGAVAWTGRDLRLAGERLPAGKRDMTPLAIAGDERWVYVLRGRGTLQRFLIAQPNQARAGGSGGSKHKGKKRRQQHQPLPGQQAGELEPPPLPEAQEVRLDKLAECMTLLVDDDKRTLVLGGPKADARLGRLWTVDPDALDWKELQLGERILEPLPPPPDPDAEPPPPQRPSFIATKNKLSGPKISAVSVDDIVGKVGDAGVEYWLTHGSGTVLDRPTQRRSVADTLPGDAALLPAMVRFNEGTARPALLIWPGVVEDYDGAPPEPQLLVWGDDPRAWMPLETPQLRAQKWARTDVFPIQVALAGVPEGLPGKRQTLDPKWNDPQHFEAMAKECKKLLKILW